VKRFLLYAALVVGGLAAGVAVGQQLSSLTLTGNEVVTAEIGGPGGGSLFVPVSQLRNAQGVRTSPGGAINITLPDNNAATIIYVAAITGASTVTAPPAPWDGQIFEIVNGTAATANTGTVTFTANTGQTVINGAVAALAAASSAEWRYNLATTTWYRIR
jgi:hypothetical protein